MRDQKTLVTFTCDECGKTSTAETRASSVRSMSGWIRDLKLYADDHYIGVAVRDACSVECAAEAVRKFLADKSSEGKL